jgi:hypothetical protein
VSAAGERFRTKLIQNATAMAQGMLAFPDEAQVLKDLEPSSIEMPAEALAAARDALSRLRKLPESVARPVLLGAIPDATHAMEDEIPPLWDAAMEHIRTQSGGEERMAAMLSDVAICLACLSLIDSLAAIEREAAALGGIAGEGEDAYAAIRQHLLRTTGVRLN